MSHAETWTNKDGRSAELELVKTTGEADTLAGEFRMANGKVVTLKATDLDAASAKKLADAKAKAAAPVVNQPVNKSVFDEVLDGDLLLLEKKKLKKYELTAKPKKYYIFYYTASWCGPCHQYSPTLVDFYKRNKNENFEIVLITSDSEENAMEDYAAEMKMPWPQLELKKVKKFESKFPHDVNSIPSVITCDLEGKIVSKTTDLRALADLVK